VETPGGYNALQQLKLRGGHILACAIQHRDGNSDVTSRSRPFPEIHQTLSRAAGRTEPAFPRSCGFLVFFIGHVTIVALHGFRKELALIVLGETHIRI